MSGPKLIQFPTPDYRDPVKALRNLADEIERGAYGDVGSVGVVLMGDTMGQRVFRGRDGALITERFVGKCALAGSSE